MKKILLILVVVIIAGALVLWWVQTHNKVTTGPTAAETATALDRLSGPSTAEQPLSPKQKQALQGLSTKQDQKTEAQIKQEEEALRLLEGK